MWRPVLVYVWETLGLPGPANTSISKNAQNQPKMPEEKISVIAQLTRAMRTTGLGQSTCSATCECN